MDTPDNTDFEDYKAAIKYCDYFGYKDGSEAYKIASMAFASGYSHEITPRAISRVIMILKCNYYELGKIQTLTNLK